MKKFAPLNNSTFSIVLFFVSTVLIITSCLKDKGPAPDPIADSNYPVEVAQIIVNRCASTGCHNSASAAAASGLDLSTWEKMFDGNNNGAVTIPYRSDQSALCYFINTDTLLGIVLKPTMPLNGTPLTKDEYLTIRNWIDNGAPDKNGVVAFSGNPSRKKFYVANQGCDLLAVFDAEKKVVMRYIDCGVAPATEVPHTMKMSPDGQYYYAVFYAGNVFQKFRASDDSLVASCNLQYQGWSSMAFSDDSQTAYITDLDDGSVAKINLVTMASPAVYYNVFNNAHGIALSPQNGLLYVTNQYSNFIYRCDPNDLTSPDQVHIAPGGFLNQNSLNPHEIVFSPDGKKYFLSCDFSNEIRVMDATVDTLLAVIPAPLQPKEFAVSTKAAYPYLFVSCMEAPSPQANNKGAVLVLNMNTLQIVKTIDVGFYQPHGIAINEDEGLVYVASRNIDSNGPPPHHISECGGRNGFMKMIRVSDLSLLPWKNEISVDPYSVFYRK